MRHLIKSNITTSSGHSCNYTLNTQSNRTSGKHFKYFASKTNGSIEQNHHVWCLDATRCVRINLNHFLFWLWQESTVIYNTEGRTEPLLFGMRIQASNCLPMHSFNFKINPLRFFKKLSRFQMTLKKKKSFHTSKNKMKCSIVNTSCCFFYSEFVLHKM